MNYKSPLTPEGGINTGSSALSSLWGVGGCTVIIPTYNGAKKVVNCLHSLEKQTFKDFETIVVIDGSTDNTQEVLEAQKLEKGKEMNNK